MLDDADMTRLIEILEALEQGCEIDPPDRSFAGEMAQKLKEQFQ